VFVRGRIARLLQKETVKATTHTNSDDSIQSPTHLFTMRLLARTLYFFLLRDVKPAQIPRDINLEYFCFVGSDRGSFRETIQKAI
jgi:hypothetical protein